ncbi:MULTISPECIES: hypothetical protein [unclassified Rhizobium]|uniref:hypothetical protein n=1 Tax=unclassified Rhizobium TaxID=2613769 RepID=UPI0011A761E0|nr:MULTISPECIES: hypothetical protein [unclassified Rhizobium]
MPILMRLRQGSRYVIAIQTADGAVASKLFWNELQALSATRISRELWPHVRTDVFGMVHPGDLPAGALLFARKNRRGHILAVVAWRADGIDPVTYTSIEEATAALHAKAIRKKISAIAWK